MQVDEQLDSDISIRIGGDAGQGVESSGAGFCKALARAGLHVFAAQDYRSRIRGGHNFYQIRAATRPVAAQRVPPDLLVALTAETLDVHLEQLPPGAGVIYEESLRLDERIRFRPDAAQIDAKGLRLMPVPLLKTAADHGSRVMANTAALGALAGVTDFPLERIMEVIRENFAAKGSEVVDANLAVAAAAHRVARERHADFPHPMPRGDGRARVLIRGNHAFALGALAAGCRFVSAYPMTPATSIIEYLASIAAEYGVVTKHAEDEIAAVCMAIGAAHVGARALTATSGGGFALMTEALGLAGITETPLVVVSVQRGGPSTGMPTRTEQSDLLFALHASQGEFPRIVIAPGNIEECFEAGARAFNLAERYQCPVIVLSDLLLASSLQTAEPETFGTDRVSIDRGALLAPGAPAGAAAAHRPASGADPAGPSPARNHPWEAGAYPRFAVTDTGISPRPLPGDPAAVFTATSDEHTEDGHITEEIHTRARMMRKRMRKEDTALRDDIRPPNRFGPGQASLTLVCWGSTTGAAREAAARLTAAGTPCAVLQFQDLWPFPADAAAAALDAAGLTIGIEQSYTGQLAKLIRMMTGRALDRQVLAYDGRPFSPEDMLTAVQRCLNGEIQVHVEPGEPPLPLATEVGVNV
ncbi:MAG: pyruvate ferredoxin oxidoreductase [Gammaproteobacteria bacterium]|nr:pyruvate ferredoxin oxidoreductase [Porticoccaceae bacterium]MBK79948.1 pyruvate ferredoxin oxidoreductase [Gammaproteobacteria bacterium]|tara:strand:- start:3274 stop:5202 length:1929 start_codon:yes stop_codon:yes gene_type:complete